MTMPEYSPQGTSITFNAFAVPPMVYRLKLKPAQNSIPGNSAFNATVCMQPSNCPTITSGSSTGSLVATNDCRRGRRQKSYSESALRLERMLPPADLSASTQYNSRSDTDIAHVITISGYSKTSQGIWVFKVDVGGPADNNAYVVRRRFTDFKLLHEGLSQVSELPKLPPHGIVSVFQMLVSPDNLLTARAARLQKLLLAIHSNPMLRKSKAFSAFIGKNPSSLDTGYVSLSGYEVPKTQRLNSTGSYDINRSV